MSETSQNLSRRKFMAVGSAAIATPLLLKLMDPVEEAKSAEKSAAKSAAKAAAKKTVKKDKIYYITDECVGCHACKVFCPQKAIFYGERKMVIDQEKCIQCGTCYNECPICVISEVKL